MTDQQIEKMAQQHKVTAEFTFEPVPLEKGYTNRTLHIDLEKGEIGIRPVTQEMKDLWVGGKGFDLWLTLQEINKDTKWDSPENPICFSSGPLGGTTSFPGAGKTLVTAISPLTGSIMDCNVGGYFGPFLKFCGFDSLCLTGKTKNPSIILIDGVAGKITIEEAPAESIDAHLLAEELTEMYADDELDKKNIAVVMAGRGAQHTRMGVLNFSFYDWRRKVARLKQAGRGGVGTVFMHKGLKALVIKQRDVSPAWKIEENKVTKLVAPKTDTSCLSCDKIGEIHQLIERWNCNPEYVIEILQDIQERFRHIPEIALDEVRAKTGVSKAHLYHIATFYKSFSLEEQGETTIQVCLGTACHVKGSARILNTFERILDVKAGDTTTDKKFTLEGVACLGACSIAPVVKVGEEVIGNVKAGDVAGLIAEARNKTEKGAAK